MYPTPQLTRDRGGPWRGRRVTKVQARSRTPSRAKTDSISAHLSRADRGAPCAVSVACVDERLSGDQNTACNYFGAADHELPEFQDGTKKFEPHPFANWHQTWDDVEKFGATG